MLVKRELELLNNPYFMKRLVQFGDEYFIAKVLLFSYYSFGELASEYDITYSKKLDKVFDLMEEFLLTRFRGMRPDTQALSYFISKIQMDITDYKSKVIKNLSIIDKMDGNKYIGFKVYNLLTKVMEYYYENNMSVFNDMLSFIKVNPNISETYLLNRMYNNPEMYNHKILVSLFDNSNPNIYLLMDVLDIYLKKNYEKRFNISPYIDMMFTYPNAKLKLFEFLQEIQTIRSFDISRYNPKLQRFFIYILYTYIHEESKKLLISFLDDTIFEYSNDGNQEMVSQWQMYLKWYIDTYDKDKIDQFDNKGYEECDELIPIINNSLQYCMCPLQWVKKVIGFSLDKQLLFFYAINRLYLFRNINENYLSSVSLRRTIIWQSFDNDPTNIIENGNIINLIKKIM
jgi:hypothetical protein